MLPDRKSVLGDIPDGELGVILGGWGGAINDRWDQKLGRIITLGRLLQLLTDGGLGIIL